MDIKESFGNKLLDASTNEIENSTIESEESQRISTLFGEIQAQVQYDSGKTLRLLREIESKVEQFDISEKTLCSLRNIDCKLESISEKVRSNEELVCKFRDEHYKNVKQTEHIYEYINKVKEEVLESISQRIWSLEQRFVTEQIRSLRQKRKAIIVGSCEHRNIGDVAITYAEQELLLAQFPDYEQYEFSTYEMERQWSFLQAIVNEQDIIFIHGGGNLGSLYREEEEVHRLIIGSFPSNKIVVFPQTIYFENTEHGNEELSKSQEVYNRHPDLTIFARSMRSVELAREYFPQVHVYLMPDTVMYLQNTYHLPRKNVLLCLREDEESALDLEQKNKLIAEVASFGEEVDYSNNMALEDVSRNLRAEVAKKELIRYASAKVVVTDRLHGVIFSAVTNTPCVALNNNNSKVYDYYETFLKDVQTITFIGKDIERIQSEMNRITAIREGKQNNLIIRESFQKFRELCSLVQS